MQQYRISTVFRAGWYGITRVLSPIVCLQISIWDSFTRWWGSEEVGAIRRRKKPVANKAILKPKIKA